MGHDFAGWVTHNDILCSDGVVIKQDAFKGNDQTKVPLVWNHDHSEPNNVLGHMILHNKEQGVYGYGYFNKSESAAMAKELLINEDIVSMSIGANKIRKQGNNVVHGKIFEVSLVLAGANQGALIDEVITHYDSDEMEAVIYTGLLIHAEEDKEEEVVEEETKEQEEKTVTEVLDTLNEEQEAAVEVLIAQVIEDQEAGNSEEAEDDELKQNLFDKTNPSVNDNVLLHSQLNEALKGAVSAEVGSLQDYLKANMEDKGQTLQHAITGIETLFPEAHNLNPEPMIWMDENTGAAEIVNGTTKSPFARIKIRGAKFTEDEARARGYIKGNEKIEQIFTLFERETYPQTIYKKQQLDRDDIIDITDFNVVAFINREMRMMLIEELGRAILVGDGRTNGDASKIKEDKIRPIISDDDFYTLKATYTSEEDLVESVILGMIDYKGSGSPIGYIDPRLLAKTKLLKGTDGRYLMSHIPTDMELAALMGLGGLKPTTLMKDKGLLVVNLRDYTVGSTKGGEVTTFEDFDIDFNKHKYLIETRISGALTKPHAAIAFSKAAAPASAQTQSAPAANLTK